MIHLKSTHLARNLKKNSKMSVFFVPDFIGVSQADWICKCGVPELSDWGAKLLVLVGEQHTKKRREQAQQFTVEG